MRRALVAPVLLAVVLASCDRPSQDVRTPSRVGSAVFDTAFQSPTPLRVVRDSAFLAQITKRDDLGDPFVVVYKSHLRDDAEFDQEADRFAEQVRGRWLQPPQRVLVIRQVRRSVEVEGVEADNSMWYFYEIGPDATLRRLVV